MPDEVPSIHDVIDDRIACLQELAATGDAHAGDAAKQPEAFRAEIILRQDERLGWVMLTIVEPLIESLLAARMS